MAETRFRLWPLLLVPVLFSGGSFGFFFAWQVSTVSGLDMLPPGLAIEAMAAMNASVRNPAFAALYFGTPVVLAVFAVGTGFADRRAALALGAALAVHMAGIFLTTALVNVPLNTGLAEADPAGTLTRAGAAAIWQDYALPWMRANLLRTLAGALALSLAGLALGLAARGRP